MGAATGRSLLLVAAVAVGAGLVRARAALAQDSAARPWYEEITVNGFASTSYSYNLNRPASRSNAYRVFDFDDNTFKLDVAELVVQHAAAKAQIGRASCRERVCYPV